MAEPARRAATPREPRGLLHELGRIRVRLLVVNLVVVLVPVVGIEFARLYERTLLEALERDMRNQAVLTARMLEADLAGDIPLSAPAHVDALTRAAVDTRMRIRVLDATGATVADSHAEGPPEGPEPPVPSILPDPLGSRSDNRYGVRGPPGDWDGSTGRWPDVPDRKEVRDALEGRRSAYTRVRERLPAVLLFLTEPVRNGDSVVGVVYVVRSTQPVLAELYRIRAGLYRVLLVALGFTLLVTLALAWSISRPLARLSRAAKRIAAGEKDVRIPVGGGGEIRALGEAFATMTERLDQRMRYISDFAADVAHEFKSPLTSIRGAAELLSEGALDDPEARTRFLSNIQLDTERLDRLVSRLLVLSRIEASDTARSDVDLPELLRDVAERAGGEGRPVQVRYAAQATTVRAREQDLSAAVLNLLDNATRFSPEGAPVEIDVGEAGDTLVVTVRDHGPGIPEETLPHVFDRFFTTDSDRGGTGLGLAIARTVIEAHGGRITATNAPGGGAAFSFTLPAPRTRR